MTGPPPPYPQQQYTGPGAPPPPPEGGAVFKPSDHVGDLVWLRVKNYEPDFAGQYGAKPAIYIDVEVLAGRSQVGQRFTDSLHTNWMLVGQLQEHVGAEYFGRIGEQPDRSIYLANPAPGDEQWVNAFLARRQGGQQRPPAPPQAQQPAQSYQQQPWPPQNGPAQQQTSPAQAPPVNQGSYDPPPF